MSEKEYKWEAPFAIVRETPWSRETYSVLPNPKSGYLEMRLVEKIDKTITNKIWD